MKHLRQGDVVAALVILQQFWLASVNLGSSLAQRRKPLGFGRLLSLAQGVYRSFELEIDPLSSNYRLRATNETTQGRTTNATDSVEAQGD
jgi:hypothetical protein